MSKNLLKSIGLFFFLIGCKTLNFDQASQIKTTQQLQLGSIGAEKEFLLQHDFNNSAIPNYQESIKLSVSIKSFNKQSYINFTKAKALQSADVNIKYVDSVKNKPHYIKLKIADKVAIVKALNTKDNQDIKSYLSHNKNANVVTSISIALSENDLKRITNADAVFLTEEAHKMYELQFYEDNKKEGSILFNQGVVFEYKTSNCCWQENNKYQLNIVDLVEGFNNCPNSTYRSANKAKKKINYYKLY